MGRSDAVRTGEREGVGKGCRGEGGRRMGDAHSMMGKWGKQSRDWMGTAQEGNRTRGGGGGGFKKNSDRRGPQRPGEKKKGRDAQWLSAVAAAPRLCLGAARQGEWITRHARGGGGGGGGAAKECRSATPARVGLWPSS